MTSVAEFHDQISRSDNISSDECSETIQRCAPYGKSTSPKLVNQTGSNEKMNDSAFSSEPEELTSVSSDSFKSGNVSKVAPSILVTSPTDLSPSIIITSPSDGSLKEGYSPSSSFCRDPNDSIIDSDGEADYYEEYHLPNTHESAFVRHLSFRKKVHKTNIFAPDAERVEGLLRNGEFARSGSIRRRILHTEEGDKSIVEEEEFDYYDDVDEMLESKGGSFSTGIERGNGEIEKYLSDENLGISYSDDNLQPLESRHRNNNLKRSSSTPVVYLTDTVPDSVGTNFLENAQSVQDMSFNEFKRNVSIEEGTLKKIRECLDFSSYRDLLNLSGKLTDLLSPQEVQELLAHSHKYQQFIDTQVFEALSLSYQVNNQDDDSTTVSRKTTRGSGAAPRGGQNPPDSGFSSPKTVTDEDISILRKSVEDVETPSRVKIPAPSINLDSSTDSKLFENDDDSSSIAQILASHSPLEDDESLSYKRIVSATNEMFERTPSEESYEHHITFNRPRSDSMTNLEDGSIFNISSMCLSSDESPETYSGGRPPQNKLCPTPPDLIPELSAAEEGAEVRHWRNVVIGGMWRRIDMKVIAPYRKCISHGGYLEVTRSPVVVLSSVLLPDKSRKDYNYVMDNLFMYVLSYLEQLAADNYVLVYLAGGSQTAGPGFHWMRKAYDMIDRRLRKHLKTLLVVHPSLWAKTLVTLSRPFISSKFYRKLHFIHNLTELAQIISLDQLEIPDSVKQVDFEIMIKMKKRSVS